MSLYKCSVLFRPFDHTSKSSVKRKSITTNHTRHISRVVVRKSLGEGGRTRVFIFKHPEDE